MAFVPADLYTVSAGVELYNYWNPFVTKHDASSFYNWEQDNLPLYDVEERTDFLWERFGWPTSSLPGMALCVSSSLQDGNNNVFTSLEDAINALPEIIRMPTLIEVATSGDLGSLELKNIKCVGDGKLEIVNRIFAPMSQAAAATVSTTATRRAITSVVDGDFFDTVAATSALSVSSNVSSLFGDGAVGYNGMSFVTQANRAGGTNHRPDKLSVNFHAGATSYSFLDSTTSTALVGDIGSTTDSDVVDPDIGLDYVPTGGGQTLMRTEHGSFGTDGSSIGIFTNNYLRKVKIFNCDGPIYIRGFGIQGATGASTPTYHDDYGISIKNSDGVVIENCGVARCKIGGMYVSNSDVTLNRRFFSGRNYDADRGTKTTYGLNAVNSTITLSSDTYSYGYDSVYMFYQHDYGMHLKNSQLIGGANPVNSERCSLRSCYNSEAGIKLVNSVVDLEGYVDVYSNRIGIEAVGSELILDGLICQFNDKYGIESDNSKIKYNRKAVTASTSLTNIFGGDAVSYKYITAFYGNGIHLNLNNSRYEPFLTEDLDDSCAYSLFAHSVGADELSVEPGISLNNSKAKLVHCRISTVGETDTADYTVQLSLSPTLPAYGAAICAKNNSQVELIGSKNLATVITGPYATSRRDAGVFVDKGSSCRVSGPFFIGQFGTAMYANAGSEISFTPHYNNSTNGFDQAGFDLTGSVLNHTSAEVHAYGPCFVVDNNSTLSMRDLGNAFVKYPTAVQEEMDFIAGYNTNTSAYTHAGSMCFFPNVLTDEVTPVDLKSSFPGYIKYSGEPHGNFVFQSGSFGTGKNYNYYLASPGRLQHSVLRTNISTGGPCLEAFGNSVVNVTNVCFHTSDENTDGVIYDFLNSPNGCNDLRYWSFAGGATLNCNHVAVSGTYPSYAGYTGPAAVYYDLEDPLGLVPSSVFFEAFNDWPYGYRFGLSSISGLDFRVGPVSGFASPLTGKVGEGYFGESLLAGHFALSGSSPYVSGLSVLDIFGKGTNILTPGTYDTTSAAFQAIGGTGLDYLPFSSKKYQRDTRAITNAFTTPPITTYYGASWWGASGYENTGPFRLFLEPDPYCHNLRYVDCSSNYDNRVYQTFSQGYHVSGTLSSISDTAYSWNPHGGKIVGTGKRIDSSAMYIGVEDMVRPENYNIRLDESAAHMFANAKHCSIEFLGRPKMVDIYKSGHNTYGGSLNSNAPEGLGAGFKSPHTFDLRRRY